MTGIANSAFSDFYMTSIKIPSSIKTIDSQAFCDALIDKITIPSSVISIGSGAFSSSFIDAITFESTGDIHDYSADMFTALGNTNIPKAIYVPKGMKEAYCQQLPDYADIIQEKEMTPTGITNVTKAEKNTHPTIKMVKNGKVVIVKGDKEYTIGGARIK